MAVGENTEFTNVTSSGCSNQQSSITSAVNDCLTKTSLREIKFSYSKAVSLVIPAKVRGVPTHAIIDTAAQASIISEELADTIFPPLQVKEEVILRGAEKSSNMIAKRVTNVPLGIGQHNYTWDLLIAPIADPFILGLDFLKAKGGLKNLMDDSVVINGDRIYAEMRKNLDKTYSVQRVVLKKKVVVPPNSVITTTVQFSTNTDKSFLIHAPEKDHKGLLIPYALVKLGGDNNSSSECTIYLQNDSNQYV